MLSGNVPRAKLDYSCHSPAEPRWFRVQAEALRGRGEVLVMQDDISDLVLGLGRLTSVSATDGDTAARDGHWSSSQASTRGRLWPTT